MTKQSAGMFLAVSTALWMGLAAAEEHGHPHHQLPKDIDAFHAVIAPLWHARPGPERSLNACAQAGEMDRTARAITSADARPLVAALATFGAKCKGQPAAVDAAFADVHEAFHRLIDVRPTAAAR